MASILGNWRSGGSRRGAVDLAAAIELQVRDGRLPPGTKLPAERELGEALGVSRTLIGAALEKLRCAGIVASKMGAGSWITLPKHHKVETRMLGDTELIDLAKAAPPAVAGLLPAVDAARLALVDELPKHGYSERGIPVLRERIAARYTERGLPTSADQIMITNGAHHAFVLVLRAFTGPGDRVLVELPTYPNTLEAINGTHTRPVPVSVAEGWDVDGIEVALRKANPALACLIVDFQNPTGRRLDSMGRAELGSVMAKTRTPVVVDETLVELDLVGDPVGGPAPLAAYADGWAITIGSAAKSHWGGLRLGWIRASNDVLGTLTSSRTSVDLGSPLFEQLVLAELLADADEILRPRRTEVREMRDSLADALRLHCPDWTFRLPEGGFAMWCRLPEPMSTRLAVAAANHGVRVVPGPRFGVHGGLEHWLRVPYTLPADELDWAVRRLSAAAASVRGGGESVVGPEVQVA